MPHPAVFADKGMHFGLPLSCFLYYFGHFYHAGRTSVSPVVCGFFSFAMKQATSKEASKHLSLSSVKFGKVLD